VLNPGVAFVEVATGAALTGRPNAFGLTGLNGLNGVRAEVVGETGVTKEGVVVLVEVVSVAGVVVVEAVFTWEMRPL